VRALIKNLRRRNNSRVCAINQKRGIVKKIVLLLGIAAASFASAGETIYFESGPHGGERAVTPWGNYIIVSGGDSVWIGTEDEYEHAYVVGIERAKGQREFKMEDGSRSFIDRDLPTIMVGNNQLASLDPLILFGVSSGGAMRRPHKSAGTEYFSIDWVQSRQGVTSFAVVDMATGKAYRPYRCTVSDLFHQCETIMPTGALTDPVSVVFLQSGQKPGALPPATPAQLAYRSIRLHIKSLAKDGIVVNPSDTDDDSFRNLIRLHKLDPSIPDSVGG